MGFPRLLEEFLPSCFEAGEGPRPQKLLKVSLRPEALTVRELTDPFGNNENNFFRRLQRVLRLNSSENTDFTMELAVCLQLFTECLLTKRSCSPLFAITDPLKFVDPSYTGRVGRGDPSLTEFVKGILFVLFQMFRELCKKREKPRRSTG